VEAKEKIVSIVRATAFAIEEYTLLIRSPKQRAGVLVRQELLGAGVEAEMNESGTYVM